jgi:MFS family permease
MRDLLARLKGFLGLNTAMAAVMVMVVLIGLGEKMAERFLPLYLIALGGSTLSVGFLNGMDNLLSALYSFPGGYLSDRLGYRKALILFTLVAMLGYCIVILVPTWQAVLIGAVFFISWTALTLPAVMSLVSKVVDPGKRVMGVTLHSFVRRIPMALGPVLGGLAIAHWGRVEGVRIAFIAALVLGAVAIAFVWFFVEERKAAKSEHVPLRLMLKLISPDLRNLLASDILIRFAEQIPYAFVVIWVVNSNGFTPLQFGLLTTIEMVTAMLVYIPVAYMADRYGKKPFVLMTFGFFTLFPLMLVFSRSFPMLIAAFIVRGLKEFGEPTRKALIMDLAPENAKAATFGSYYFIRDIIVSLAAFSSGFLWNISPEVNFYVAFGFGVIGTIVFAVFGRDVSVRQGVSPH